MKSKLSLVALIAVCVSMPAYVGAWMTEAKKKELEKGLSPIGKAVEKKVAQQEKEGKIVKPKPGEDPAAYAKRSLAS